MGYLVNSYAYDWGPAVFPDGLYLFFISYRTQNHDIYWIDAKIIEMLKPSELKILNDKSRQKNLIRK
jgi:Tol biopolymer transport system component